SPVAQKHPSSRDAISKPSAKPDPASRSTQRQPIAIKDLPAANRLVRRQCEERAMLTNTQSACGDSLSRERTRPSRLWESRVRIVAVLESEATIVDDRGLITLAVFAGEFVNLHVPLVISLDWTPVFGSSKSAGCCSKKAGWHCHHVAKTW